MFLENGKPHDFIYLEVNHAFERLTGLTHVEGKKVSDVIPGIQATDKELLDLYGRVASECKPERVEIYVNALDMWFSISVYCPRKEYFVAVFDVITERKNAEKEIRILNEKLEQKVAVRTKELQDSQLALLNLVDDLNQSAKSSTLANQALEATNKELEAFSYSVSHDLRAPLRSIDGFSQALLEDYQKKLDDTGRNYLERIRRAIRHMSQLIDDMLKLSWVTRSAFRRESVDLSKMFREIIKKSQKYDPARIVGVSIQKGIIIEGDRDLMRIVLTNLIDNAWKFTGRKARPKIEFGMTNQAGKKAVFIRDNGVGFDMTYVGKLFGTFQRLHTTAEFPGTGIGLATIQRIIHRHGGQVWAEGEVGKGATFYFTLPE
jgi:light-regulated signal transduction histidine kinase (bacteriophytochrome)